MPRSETHYSPEARTRLRNVYFTITNFYTNKMWAQYRERSWKMIFPDNGTFNEFDHVLEELHEHEAIGRFEQVNQQLKKAGQHPMFLQGDEAMTRDFKKGYSKDDNVMAMLFLLTLGQSRDQLDYEPSRDHYLHQMSEMAERCGKPADQIFFAELVMEIMSGEFQIEPKK